VYTETAGCNAVLLHSTEDIDATLDALAQGLSLFSAQMCTAPQNLWVSASGFKVYQRSETGLELSRTLSPQALGRAIAERIDELLKDPKRAAGICGALHSAETLVELKRVRDELNELGAICLRESAGYAHPDHPHARTATPLIGALKAEHRQPAQAERFGPISFVITASTEDEMIRHAAHDANTFGSIAAYAYSVDEQWIKHAERAFLSAGASIGINLHHQRPMNFTAAFSDFHVTGLNPAGTASLTDPGFVSRRFRIVQVKREVN
jgi:acyl-CoA reductase-like NAD-dependent aldehyde dehydrogenase